MYRTAQIYWTVLGHCQFAETTTALYCRTVRQGVPGTPPIQAAAVAREAAGPLIRGGSTSLSTTQLIGPEPVAKKAT